MLLAIGILDVTDQVMNIINKILCGVIWVMLRIRISIVIALKIALQQIANVLRELAVRRIAVVMSGVHSLYLLIGCCLHLDYIKFLEFVKPLIISFRIYNFITLHTRCLTEEA